jgi:flavorubredoxin
MSTTETDVTIQPYKVADETFVIPYLMEAPPLGFFCMNSMIIRGSEPIIVDTGTIVGRRSWLEHAWSIVDPHDVRWVFLSHDDLDHSGNLRQVLDACPNATLLTTWFQIGRIAPNEEDGWIPPLDRVRWVNDGDVIDAGDRRLTALRPPFFDNPTTRGLFDQQTRVYWAVDTFATPVPTSAQDVAEMPDADWRDGVLLTNRLNHPWFQWLDEDRFRSHVDRTRALEAHAIASCHSPAIHGSKIGQAFELILEIPRMPMWDEPTQADLEAAIAASAGSGG